MEAFPSAELFFSLDNFDRFDHATASFGESQVFF